MSEHELIPIHCDYFIYITFYNDKILETENIRGFQETEEEGECCYKRIAQGMCVMMTLFSILTVVVDISTYTCDKII